MARAKTWVILNGKPHDDGCACSMCLQFRAKNFDKKEIKPQKKEKKIDAIQQLPKRRKIKI